MTPFISLVSRLYSFWDGAYWLETISTPLWNEVSWSIELQKYTIPSKTKRSGVVLIGYIVCLAYLKLCSVKIVNDLNTSNLQPGQISSMENQFLSWSMTFQIVKNSLNWLSPAVQTSQPWNKPGHEKFRPPHHPSISMQLGSHA